MFPGFLTPVLTQLSFQSHRLLFLTCFSRGERRIYAIKKVLLNWSRTHNHQVMSLTRSSLSHLGGAKLKAFADKKLNLALLVGLIFIKVEWLVTSFFPVPSIFFTSSKVSSIMFEFLSANASKLPSYIQYFVNWKRVRNTCKNPMGLLCCINFVSPRLENTMGKGHAGTLMFFGSQISHGG